MLTPNGFKRYRIQIIKLLRIPSNDINFKSKDFLNNYFINILSKLYKRFFNNNKIHLTNHCLKLFTQTKICSNYIFKTIFTLKL